MNKKQINNIIEKAVLESIQKNTRRTYDNSQEIVPVLSGDLKSSGEVLDTSTGALVQYTMPYSSIVELGNNLRKEEKEWVEPHRRKNGTLVKGHYRTVSNNRKPNPFLTKSLYKSLESFIYDLEESLKQSDWNGKNIKIIIEK